MSDAKLEEKLTCRLENGMRNLTNFHQRVKFLPNFHLESVKIGTLMRSFCPKYKMYELNIYRRVMCNDDEDLYKN